MTHGLHVVTRGLHVVTRGLHVVTSGIHVMTHGLHVVTRGLHVMTRRDTWATRVTPCGLHGFSIRGEPAEVPSSYTMNNKIKIFNCISFVTKVKSRTFGDVDGLDFKALVFGTVAVSLETSCYNHMKEPGPDDTDH